MKKRKVRGKNSLQAPLGRWGWFFLGPVLIAFAIGFVWTFIQGIYLSMCKFRLIKDAEFIGLKNYATAFADASFIRSF